MPLFYLNETKYLKDHINEMFKATDITLLLLLHHIEKFYDMF